MCVQKSGEVGSFKPRSSVKLYVKFDRN